MFKKINSALKYFSTYLIQYLSYDFNSKLLYIFLFLGGSFMNQKILSDEGMWTLDNLPLDLLESKYKFKPGKLFLQNIQLSSVRFNDGGSGSFVSQEGLVLTNHHVAMGQLQKISKKENDYVKNGFLAKSRDTELKCPDLELNVLVKMKNVTQIIKSYLANLDNREDIEKKRKEITAIIENEAYIKSGLRSDVVELYNGGEFWLYQYKRYTDIRLVHAPEIQAAAFGGDSDNFQFPRYALDYAFFRVYEGNKPIQSKHFLKWNSVGPKKNELLLVSGHPGSTDRQKTLSEIYFLKEHSFPEYIKILTEKITAIREYASKGKEENRRAMAGILSMENSIKAIRGEYEALNDTIIMEKIKSTEANLRKIVSENQELSREYGQIWDRINEVQDKMIEKKKEMYYQNFSGQLPSLALSFVEYYIELQKPNEERYEEFRDSSLESIRLRLLTSAPVYKDKEIFTFSKGLEISQKELGNENEFIRLALDSKSPSTLARELIEHTDLDKLEFRKSLLKNPSLIYTSKDPLLSWMRKLEPIIRKNRRWVETEIENVLTTEGGKLSELKFKLFGRSTYPDATFTLRLSIGTIKPYEMDGWMVPPYTTFYGLFERAESFGHTDEYKISESIKKSTGRLNFKSKINFCTTHDITGGNSGSPVINRKGEIVGLIFDGNAYSHSLSYAYTDEKARALSVHTEGIEEMLKNVYLAESLLKELRTTR